MNSATRIVVSGATGRMGRTVVALAGPDPAFEVVGALDRQEVAGDDTTPTISTIDGASTVLARTDAIIDFSAPSFLRQLLERCADELAGRALVVGTTGLDPDTERLLDTAAEKGPVLTAANFSIGVNVLIALAERAAASLGSDFDIEIVEAHHRRKEDAPSGTALALGEAVANGRSVRLKEVRRDGRSGRPGTRPENEIGFHSIRGGDVIGDHHVHFLGEVERLELVHRASDRRLFAAGALRAARWVVGRSPGRYGMNDVLGF